MEFMKIVHMGVNNPHLKPKSSSYFNQSQPQVPAVPPTEAGSRLLLRRGTLDPQSLTAAVVHFDTFDSDVLLSRKNSLSKPQQMAEAGALSVSVDDVLLDDSPTAELLPFASSGGQNSNQL